MKTDARITELSDADLKSVIGKLRDARNPLLGAFKALDQFYSFIIIVRKRKIDVFISTKNKHDETDERVEKQVRAFLRFVHTGSFGGLSSHQVFWDEKGVLSLSDEDELEREE